MKELFALLDEKTYRVLRRFGFVTTDDLADMPGKELACYTKIGEKRVRTIHRCLLESGNITADFEEWFKNGDGKADEMRAQYLSMLLEDLGQNKERDLLYGCSVESHVRKIERVYKSIRNKPSWATEELINGYIARSDRESIKEIEVEVK